MQDIAEKIADKLGPTGWKDALGSWWRHEFPQVLEELKLFSDSNRHFSPRVKDMFRFMELTPYREVKAVMIIDDMEWGIDKDPVPYSQNMERMKEEEFKPGIKICRRYDISELLSPVVPPTGKFNYSLERWCKQGLLMMPIAATGRVDGKAHMELWKSWRMAMIDAINELKDIPVMLIEKKTWDHEILLTSKNTILYTSYPKSTHPEWPTWMNNIITSMKKEPIKWL